MGLEPKNPFRTGGLRILRDSYRFGIWRLCVVVFVPERRHSKPFFGPTKMQSQPCKSDNLKRSLFFMIAGWKTGRLRKTITPVKMYTTSRIFQFGCCLILKDGVFVFPGPQKNHPFSYSLQDLGWGILLFSCFLLGRLLKKLFSKKTPRDTVFLVGGFNPFEKNSQLGNLPQVGMKIKDI